MQQLVALKGVYRRIAVCAIVVTAVGQTGCSPSEQPPDTNKTPSATNGIPPANSKPLPAPGERRPDSLLVDGGPVTRESHEAALRRIFGDANVKQDRLHIGEGETLPGTILFPDDSSRQLMILWSDTVRRRLPSRLILRGDSSRWSLKPGITLGTTLERLEQLNGRPFTLAGFGWDYSGVVIDWRGGNLATSARNAKVYLSPPPSKYSTPSYSRVLGDKDYSSDLPAMRELRPAVYQIFYDFPEAGRK